MRFNSTLVAVATLAVLATSTALQTMTRIPLNERASFIKDNGTFDMDRAMAHLAHIENKYRQNRINIMRNVGGEAFNNSTDIELLPAVPVKLQRRFTGLSHVALENFNNEIWTGTIKIGTDKKGKPNQELSVTFDTGSADFWVTAKSCESKACETRKKYDHSISYSKIFKEEKEKITITSVSGNATGNVYTETVQVGGAKVYEQYFINAEKLTDSFVGMPQDGVLGMAYESLSSIKEPSFIAMASHQNEFARNIFGFALAKGNSELCLGGVDSRKVNGYVQYYNVVGPRGYWKIGGASAYISKIIVPVPGFQTIIDSGSAFILGPPEDIEKVFEAIGNVLSKTEKGRTTYRMPCNNYPELLFHWGKRYWFVADNFFGGTDDNNPNMCVSNVMGVEHLRGGKTWILGAAFMKNVYTAFDFEKHRVGFGLLNRIRSA